MKRRYTTEEINAATLEAAPSEGEYDALLAGEVVGRVRHRYTGGGRRQGWEAITNSHIRLPHRGEGTYAKTKQAALVDLLLGLEVRAT